MHSQPANPAATAFSVAALVPAVVAGLVTGVVVVIIALSFAVLIFAGDLSPHMGTAIGMVMFTGIVVGTLVALFSSYPGSIAFPQDKIAPILALMASLIVADLPKGTPPDMVFATVMAALMAATLLTGLLLLALGVWRLGGFIRFIPYPVIGGFLAGTGWLLVRGSLKVMTGLPMTLESVPELFTGAILIRWVPGLAFALMLLVCMRRFRHVATMPVLLASGVGLFHLARMGLGVSVPEIEAGGFVLGHLPAEVSWRPDAFIALFQADWGAVFRQAGTVSTILLISAIGVLLNSSGLEVAANQDMDLNRELKVAGVANIISAVGGGIVGFHTLGLSTLVLKMGVRSRVVGLVSASCCLVMLILGAEPLALFPKAVLGGLLMFLGLGFLLEWLHEGWHKMSKADYLIVVMIVGIVGAFGYLHGAAAGIVACVVLFVVNYSRVAVAKHELTGSQVSSNVDRSVEETRMLHQHGGRILVLSLQGFMFFGTANKLLTRVLGRCAEGGDNPVQFVVFDFRRVPGIDSSAAMSFAKMRQAAEKRGLVLVFAQMAPEIRRLLVQAGFVRDFGPTWRVEHDLDHALEWCENDLLESLDTAEMGTDSSVMGELARILPDQAGLDRLVGYMEKRDVAAGEVLLRQGDTADDLYVLEDGRVTVQIDIEGGDPVRLRTMHSGTVVGEMGLYLGETRSASVVADQPCRIYRLTGQELARMEAEAPAAAAAFHRVMARRLAERLRNTDHMIKALVD